MQKNAETVVVGVPLLQSVSGLDTKCTKEEEEEEEKDHHQKKEVDQQVLVMSIRDQKATTGRVSSSRLLHLMLKGFLFWSS